MTAAFQVYCDMEGDGGGWTLLMKIDGRDAAFDYPSSLWENGSRVNETSIDMSESQAKLRIAPAC